MIDVVVLGELLIDFAAKSTDSAGYPTMAANPGGAPGNFLAALNAYGRKTAFLGKVGNDAFGNLLLDDGEPCVCVQAISYSLLCRYFREAVLPADRELCADLAATADTRKKCELCGKPFPARSNRAKYCDRCAPYAARRNAAERKRRQRAKARCVTV